MSNDVQFLHYCSLASPGPRDLKLVEYIHTIYLLTYLLTYRIILVEYMLH